MKAVHGAVSYPSYLVNHAGTQSEGDFWSKHHYDLKASNIASKDYEVVIEGQVGDGHLGDIAIDDIALSVGCTRIANPLPGHPTGTTLPPAGK